jgi:hypothetical protein
MGRSAFDLLMTIERCYWPADALTDVDRDLPSLASSPPCALVLARGSRERPAGRTVRAWGRAGALSPWRGRPIGRADRPPSGGARLQRPRFERLRQSGWTDGRNLQIDIRWAAGDSELNRKYATELIALAPDAILAVTSLAMGYEGSNLIHAKTAAEIACVRRTAETARAHPMSSGYPRGSARFVCDPVVTALRRAIENGVAPRLDSPAS